MDHSISHSLFHLHSQSSFLLFYPSSPYYNGPQIHYLSPLTLGYYDFSITPSLPSSLHFDPNDGWIIGSFINITTPLQFSISATRINGGNTTISFSLSVQTCTLLQGLITLRFHSQSYQSLSWNLFQSQSTLIASSDPFLVVLDITSLISVSNHLFIPTQSPLHQLNQIQS